MGEEHVEPRHDRHLGLPGLPPQVKTPRSTSPGRFEGSPDWQSHVWRSCLAKNHRSSRKSHVVPEVRTRSTWPRWSTWNHYSLTIRVRALYGRGRTHRNAGVSRSQTLCVGSGPGFLAPGPQNGRSPQTLRPRRPELRHLQDSASLKTNKPFSIEPSLSLDQIAIAPFPTGVRLRFEQSFVQTMSPEFFGEPWILSQCKTLSKTMVVR